MKNKEKLLKDIEEFTKNGDIKSYILICDKGSTTYSRGKTDLLSDITTFIHWQYMEKKNLTEHDINSICRYAKMSNDELEEELKKNLNKTVNKAINNNKFDELEKLIKKIGDEIKNG